MNLQEVQNAFQDYVLALKPDIEAEIAGRPGVSAGERLEIYAQAYRLRLVDVLQDNFPGITAWLDEEEFDRLAITYIDANPSRRFSVRWFGDGLAQFLRTADPWRARPALAEMAEFEWALADAFDAPDEMPLTREHLTSLPAADWPDLRFRFQCGLRRLDFHWNVVDVWEALQAESKVPELHAVEVQPWLIWRADLKSRFRLLSGPEARVLDAARAGAGFAELCELLSREDGEHNVAAEAAGLLQRWVGDELLVVTPARAAP
jgi:hypothetical protein